MKGLLLAVLAAAATAAQAAAPTGIANVIGAKSWQNQDNPPYGMYSFTMDADPQVKLVASGVVPGNFGAVYVDGRYFVIEGIATSASSFITNYIYDAETWTKITDFRGENITAFDMVWDETTDKVYGYFHNFDTSEEFFGTIDIDTGKTEKIGNPGFKAMGLGCDSEGALFAISDTGALYSIDKSDASATLIGQTGCASKWTTSGAIDSSTRTFYYTTCNDDSSRLYAIDLATAKATPICVIPDDMEMTGFYFPQPSANPQAPAEAADLTASFPQGALSGSITFTVPTTLFGGSAASGEASYEVRNGNATLAKGNAAYGTNVSIPAEMAEAGEYLFTVILSNEAGNSPVARLKTWIGPDVPAPVGKVEIAYDGNGTFSLSWPEAKALHGGWYDPETVTYNVVRYGESTARFDGQTSNSFTDTVSLPYEDEYATYHYEVAAVFGTQVSSYTSSEYYTIGSRTPPFEEQFNQRWDLGKFTIFEGDKKDWERWSYDSKAATVLTSTSTGADDYLLLPPLMLEAGWRYDIAFDVKGKYSSDTERLEVLAGEAPSVEALTETVLPPTEFKGTDYRTLTMDFTPAKSGTYFIAIHAISDPYKGAITVDNIKVSVGVETAVEGVEASETIVSTRRGAIIVKTDAENTVEAFTLSGTRIFSGKGDAEINAMPGIYVVKVGSNAIKIALR